MLAVQSSAIGALTLQVWLLTPRIDLDRRRGDGDDLLVAVVHVGEDDGLVAKNCGAVGARRGDLDGACAAAEAVWPLPRIGRARPANRADSIAISKSREAHVVLPAHTPRTRAPPHTAGDARRPRRPRLRVAGPRAAPPEQSRHWPTARKAPCHELCISAAAVMRYPPPPPSSAISPPPPQMTEGEKIIADGLHPGVTTPAICGEEPHGDPGGEAVAWGITHRATFRPTAAKSAPRTRS